MAQQIQAASVGDSTVQIQMAPSGPVEQDISALGRILDFGDFTSSVADIAGAMTRALRAALPDEAEVTFRLDVAVEAGKLTSLLVQGNGQAAFEVRLLWRRSEHEPGDGR